MTERTSWLATVLFLLPLLALAAQAGAQGAATPASAAELPITRLALFTSGVGYFEHQGVVVGDQELVLRVPKSEMDDLLQSLVLQDEDGGVVEAVRYSSQAPLSRLLGGFSFDLAGAPTLLELLAQAQGELVRLEGASVVEGALLGVEEEAVAEGVTRAFVTLSTTGGLRRVALDELNAVRFLDEAVAAELEAALATLRANRNDDVATVTLRFSGEGERRVRAAYVREMPLWKSSYRLVVGEDGVADLQGWAIVDNPTDEALEGVRLSFVAGQPASFVTSLYAPVWADRPRVQQEATGGIVPQVDSGEFRSMPSMAREAAFDLASPAPAAPPPLSGAGVTSQAEGAATATSFAYHVQEPVSIGPNQSALVPIVVTEVAAHRLSLFDDANHATHPLHAVRLVNDTGLQLSAGTVTIYDEAGFAGNARLPDLLPGDERLLAYAVDLDLRVSVGAGPRTTAVTRALLRGGVVEVTELTRLTLNVSVEGGPEEGRFLVVQGPPMPGFEVVEPKPAPAMTDMRPRFGIALVGADGAVPDGGPAPTHLVCRPAGACELEVVAERVDASSVSLSDLGEDRLFYFLENAELSAEDRARLEQVIEVKGLLRDAESALARTESAIAVIFAEQQRIRSNMGALDRDSDLYRRYVSELNEQEDELAKLRRQQEAQLEERDALQRRVSELVGSFSP